MTHDSYRARDRRIRSITLWGGFLNLLLMLLKIVFGLFLRSTALIADGIHSLSDLATDFVVLVGSRLSNRPADESHPYGHQKFETVSAVLIALILLAVSGGLIWTAFRALLKGEGSFPGPLVLVIAGISVVSKEIVFQLTRRIATETRSASLYANAWHHRSDALSSVAVLLGGFASILGWHLADLAATIVVGFMILGVGIKIFYDGMVELTEHSADHESIDIIKGILSSQSEIKGWHALRTRKLGGELFVDLHVLLDSQMNIQDGHEISLKIEKEIQGRLSKPANVLIHIDPDTVKQH
jgi:cation diffusion facilitator family transporter